MKDVKVSYTAIVAVVLFSVWFVFFAAFPFLSWPTAVPWMVANVLLSIVGVGSLADMRHAKTVSVPRGSLLWLCCSALPGIGAHILEYGFGVVGKCCSAAGRLLWRSLTAKVLKDDDGYEGMRPSFVDAFERARAAKTRKEANEIIDRCLERWEETP